MDIVPLTHFQIMKKSGKKKIKPALKAVGYKLVKEDISTQDLDFLKKVIRKEVASILRDIWIKRTSWT